MKMQFEVAWTRKYNLNYMASFAYMFSNPTTKFSGFSLKNFINQGVGGQAICWVGSLGRKEFNKKIQNRFLENQKKFINYVDYYNQYKINFIKIAKTINTTNFEALDNNELIGLYRKFEQANLDFILMGQWVPFEFSEMIPQLVETQLQKANFDAEQIDKILATVLTPFSETAIMKYEKETLMLALSIRNMLIDKEQFKNKISELVKKYAWIPAMMMETPAWDEKYFKNEIDNLAKSPDLKHSLDNLADLKITKNQKKKYFQKLLKENPEFKDLFNIANQVTYFKDERDETRRLAYFLSRPLFYKIAERLKINVSHLMCLASWEIIDLLKNGDKSDFNEIKKRQQCFAIISEGKKIIIYSGKVAENFCKNNLDTVKDNKKNKISGIIACAGITQGRVKIIFDKKDLKKIKKDDIMVSITTHPDYVSAMRLARAIVTDEGGLTCHAAIVAREMNKPCIVGTRNATKVLKDGDMVEVDANTGMVRKIE